MNAQTQETTLAQRLIDLHFLIWNDPKPENRKADFARVYTNDIAVADGNGQVSGYDEVLALILKVQGGHPGFVFTPDPVQWHHDLGRVSWGYGPRSNPDLIRGEDVFTIRDGKLRSLHVFFSTPAGSATP